MPPYQDLITKALLDAIGEEQISIWSAFAAQTILDINSTLGARTSEAYRELLSRAAVAGKSLCINLHDIGKLSKEHMEAVKITLVRKWGSEKDAIRTQTISQGINQAIRNNPIITSKLMTLVEALEASQTSDQSRILPSPEVDFFFAHNPVHGGMGSLKLALSMEGPGVDLANSFAFVTAAAHLYNAADKIELLRDRLGVLDKVIDDHVDQIFGGKRPGLELGGW
jgi:hypothetical protein